MQEQNPDYRCFRKLAGTWKNAEGTCEIVLTENQGITVNCRGAGLSGSYGVYQVSPADWFREQLPSPMMMGMMESAVFHIGEDIMIRLKEKALKDGEQILFNIDGLWHDQEDKIHLKLEDISDGKKAELILFREDSGDAPVLKEGESLCLCGQIFSGRFCPNCGSARQDQK